MANERAEQFRGKAKALIKREVDQYKQDFVTTLTTADTYSYRLVADGD